jgi:hypothetical protein
VDTVCTSPILWDKKLNQSGYCLHLARLVETYNDISVIHVCVRFFIMVENAVIVQREETEDVGETRHG